MAAAGTGASSELPLDGRRRSVQEKLVGSLTGAAPNPIPALSGAAGGRQGWNAHPPLNLNARRQSFSGSQAAAITGLGLDTPREGQWIGSRSRPQSAPPRARPGWDAGPPLNLNARRLSFSGSEAAAITGLGQMPSASVGGDGGASLGGGPSALTPPRDGRRWDAHPPLNMAARQRTFSGSQAGAITGLRHDGWDTAPRANVAARRLSHSGSATAALLGIKPLPSVPNVPVMFERPPAPYHEDLDDGRAGSDGATPRAQVYEKGRTPFAIDGEDEEVQARRRHLKSVQMARRQSYSCTAAAALVEEKAGVISADKEFELNAPSHKQRRHFAKAENRLRRGSLSSDMSGVVATPRAASAPVAGKAGQERGLVSIGRGRSARRMSDFHTSMLHLGSGIAEQAKPEEGGAPIEKRAQLEQQGRRGSMLLQYWREQELSDIMSRQHAARGAVAPPSETKIPDAPKRRASRVGPVAGAHEGGKMRHATDSSAMKNVLFNR